MQQAIWLATKGRILIRRVIGECLNVRRDISHCWCELKLSYLGSVEKIGVFTLKILFWYLQLSSFIEIRFTSISLMHIDEMLLEIDVKN